MNSLINILTRFKEEKQNPIWGCVFQLKRGEEVSEEKILEITRGIENVSLLHEAVFNPKFKLEIREYPEHSLEKLIKDNMHKAFWDILRDQLNQQPPCFDNAIQLLGEIKNSIFEVANSSNRTLMRNLHEVLDIGFIRQQAEQGILNVRAYAKFIIETLQKLCAPIRDPELTKLSNTEDIIELFRGILEMITQMKLDLSNYFLREQAGALTGNLVEYEKMKFRECLKYSELGFPITELWLRKHHTVGNSVQRTVYKAYIELLDWDKSECFPEVIFIDKERILELSQKTKMLAVCASVQGLFSLLPIFSQHPEHCNKLAEQIENLLINVGTQAELEKQMEIVWLHIKSAINDVSLLVEMPHIDAEVENTLKEQILVLSDRNTPVRFLMWKRLQRLIQLSLTTTYDLVALPPGYSNYKMELKYLVTHLKRIFTHNYSVFAEYFSEIFKNKTTTTTEEESK